jgi:hypothetical protein
MNAGISSEIIAEMAAEINDIPCATARPAARAAFPET